MTRLAASRQAARMAGVYAEATTVKVAILAGEAVGPIYTVFAAFR